MAGISALVSEFEAYTARIDARPTEDSVGYRQITLLLAPTEVSALVADVSEAIDHFRSNAPAPARRAYLLSPILFPLGRRPTPE